MTKPQHTIWRTTRRAAIGLLVVIVAVVSQTAAAGADQLDVDEVQALRLLNAERTSRGLQPVRVEATLDAGAGSHAAAMALTGVLSHSSVSSTAPAGWQRLGENVGTAGDVGEIHRLLMASPPHRAAILEPSYDLVGIGVAHGAGGGHWSTTAFAAHPSVASALVPAPAAATVTAAGVPEQRHVTPDGSVTTFGASFHGDLVGTRLAAPIVDLVPTPSDAGYWLVGSDGGVFSFGDARYLGSAATIELASPVLGMTAMPDGSGYWLTGADGGVFAFGRAPFLGTMAGRRLTAPIVRINRTSTGRGYALHGADGARYAYGDAR